MNKIRNDLIHSGDYAIYKNKKLYLKGRIDRIVKINAKIVDLNSLENVTTKFNFFSKFKFKNLTFRTEIKICNKVEWVENCYSTFLKDKNLIILFVFISSKNILKLNDSNSIKNIRNHILDNLPSHYEPYKIILLDNINLPLNEHGKRAINCFLN